MALDRAIPELFYEQLLLGELSKAHQADLKGFLESPETASKLDALRASNAEILLGYPPPEMALKIGSRLRLAKHVRARRLFWAGALASAAAAAALLLVVLVPRLGQGPGFPRWGSRPTSERTKGPPEIFVFRKRPGGAEQLGPGAEVTKGDLLQLSYLARDALFGVIFSVDGRGVATLHSPRDEKGSTELVHIGETYLPYSYQLDDAPLFERFFFVTSHRPIDVQRVLEAGQRLHGDPKKPLVLPQGCVLSKELLLKKRKAQDSGFEPFDPGAEP